MGIETIDQLATVAREKLVAQFGSRQGNFLASISLGIDNSEVMTSNDVPKSISEEESFRKLDDLKNVRVQMALLIKKLIKRLEKDGREPKTIKLSVRKHSLQNNYSRVSRQAHFDSKVLKLASKEEVAAKILDHVISLFDKMIDRAKQFDLAVINICFTNFDEQNLSKISKLFCRSDKRCQNEDEIVCDKNNETIVFGSRSPSKAFISQSKHSARSNVNRDRESEVGKCGCEGTFNSKVSQDSSTMSRSGNATETGVPGECPSMVANTASVVSTSGNIKNLYKSEYSNSQKHSNADFSKNRNFNASDHDTMKIGNEPLLDQTTPKKPISPERNCQNAADDECSRSVLCPAGIDANVFQELPKDIQSELVKDWERKEHGVLSVRGKAAPPKKRQKKCGTDTGSNDILKYFCK